VSAARQDDAYASRRDLRFIASAVRDERAERFETQRRLAEGRNEGPFSLTVSSPVILMRVGARQVEKKGEAIPPLDARRFYGSTSASVSRGISVEVVFKRVQVRTQAKRPGLIRALY
jgi:hypothetical protein